MLNMAHQDNLDQELGQNILVITHIQVEEVFYVRKQNIHVPVNKYDLNYSYSRSHLSLLPQAVAKGLINILSQKVSYDTVIIWFSTNELNNHLQICYHSIVSFGIRWFYLEFSNISRVDSLDRFRKSVVDMVKPEVYILF